MKNTTYEHLKAPANCWTALERISKAAWTLENAKPMLAGVLDAGHDHPAFHNLQIELGNIEYVLRSLPIERDDNGIPLHPKKIPGGRYD